MLNETFFGDFQTLWRGPNCLFSKSFDYARDFRDFLVWLLEYTTDVSSCFKAKGFVWMISISMMKKGNENSLRLLNSTKSCWHSTTQIVKNYLSFMPSAKNEKLIKLTFLYLALKSNISYLFWTWKKFSSQRVQWIWSGVTIQVPFCVCLIQQSMNFFTSIVLLFLDLLTVFENHQKCRIWIFELWRFLPIFVY